MTYAHRLASLLSLSLLLGGCGTASLDYLGAVRHEVSVEGQTFVVYQRAADAQVIRMDRLTDASRPGMAARMARAAEMASGCTAVPGSLVPQGDPNSSVARIQLNCG